MDDVFILNISVQGGKQLITRYLINFSFLRRHPVDVHSISNEVVSFPLSVWG